MTAVKSWK